MNTALSREVRYWRERNALSQAQLAQKAGITEATVNLVETGKVAPRPSTVKKLADALGVEPVVLTSNSFEELETPPPKAAALPVPEEEIDALVGRWKRRARRRASEALQAVILESVEDAEALGLTGLPLERVEEIANAFSAGAKRSLREEARRAHQDARAKLHGDKDAVTEETGETH